MTRFPYVTQLQPPAPFVLLTLRNPINGEELQDVPAQVDSAADRTLVPEALAQTLALPRIGTVQIGGVGGIALAMSSHPVELAIRNLPALTLEGVATPGESWILLGRDALNACRVLLDGPQLCAEVG